MKTTLNLKCKNCGHWNRFEVEKMLIQPDSPESKVQIFIPHYLPLKEEKCNKCKFVIAEPKELIRIVSNNAKL